MKKLFPSIIYLFLVLNMVYGANLSGTIYDSSLNTVSKAIIEVNPPLQRYITNDGSYYFDIAPGVYNITVYYSSGEKKEVLTEMIIIEEEGRNYAYDLFIFEDLSEEESLSSDTFSEVTVEDITKKSYWSEILVLSTIIFIFLIVWVLRKEIKKPDDVSTSSNSDTQENKNYKRSIISLLSDNQGSMTQKELRKNIPYSEAKISLWITELENEGKVKKIKKGRGNIIVLK